MPSSILINYDGTNHRIFISDDQVTCFSCKMTGHVASKCPFSIESQTDNIKDCSEPTDLINFIDNTDSNTLTENTKNNELINNDNLEMEIEQTTITTDKGGIKRATSNSTTSNGTQEPISVINKTGTKTTDEKKQTITVSTATKIQNDQIIKKSKTLIRSNSTEKLIENVNNHIEPARILLDNNKDINIDYDQIKNIIINIQGNSDPIDICKQYGTDTKTLLNTIELVRPVIKSQSLKNRLTRLSNKLFESINLEHNVATTLNTEGRSLPNDNPTDY